ncbi:MAG: hypothetical protein HN704_11940 [Bacteroidetes bacterium]|jgi:hypothetical protein|nr:hypothetical protein [Bacteroidota bacterium]MBT7142124.1 hypothetical protein [Bacteroidota bacterium]MBT7492302.1 hypothetical protein [Bacteroidota bacterium]
MKKLIIVLFIILNCLSVKAQWKATCTNRIFKTEKDCQKYVDKFLGDEIKRAVYWELQGKKYSEKDCRCYEERKPIKNKEIKQQEQVQRLPAKTTTSKRNTSEEDVELLIGIAGAFSGKGEEAIVGENSIEEIEKEKTQEEILSAQNKGVKKVEFYLDGKKGFYYLDDNVVKYNSEIYHNKDKSNYISNNGKCLNKNYRANQATFSHCIEESNENRITGESLQAYIDEKNKEIKEENARKHSEIGIVAINAFESLPEKIYIAESYVHHLKSLTAVKDDINKIWASTMQEMVDNIENMAIDEVAKIIQMGLGKSLLSQLTDKTFKGQILDVKTFEKVSKKSKDLFAKTYNYSEKTFSITKKIHSQKSLKAWKEVGELLLSTSIDISKNSKYVFKASPIVKFSLIAGELTIYGSVYYFAKGKKDINIMEQNNINRDIQFANTWINKMKKSFNCLDVYQNKKDSQSFGKHVMDNNCFDCQLNTNSVKSEINHLFTWINDLDKRGFCLEKSAEQYQKLIKTNDINYK